MFCLLIPINWYCTFPKVVILKWFDRKGLHVPPHTILQRYINMFLCAWQLKPYSVSHHHKVRQVTMERHIRTTACSIPLSHTQIHTRMQARTHAHTQIHTVFQRQRTTQQSINATLRHIFPIYTCIKSHLTFQFKMFPLGTNSLVSRL